MPVDALTSSVADHVDAPAWLLGGCETTLRPDLPVVLRELGALGPVLGLWTDGMALAKPAIAKTLHKAGVRFVRMPFHSARADAHDWVTGTPGSLKRVSRAIAVARACDLVVHAEIVPTRPTMPYLEETVQVLCRLGVGRIVVKRAVVDRDAAPTVAARFGLLQPWLADATRIAARAGVPLFVEDFPHCVVPNGTAHVRVVNVPATERPPKQPGCRRCADDCIGAPPDYVDRFGWRELQSGGNSYEDVRPEVVAWYEGAVKPPPRAGRHPATRVADAKLQALRETLGGDPMVGISPVGVPAEIRIHIDRDEPTRAIRKRAVEASQHGARTVVVTGDLDHPEIAELLRDMKRLSFDTVEVEGRFDVLADASDRVLRRLRGITRVRPALNGDDDANLAVADRLAALVRTDVRPYRLVGGPADLTWNRPEPAEVRLLPEGGRLADLADPPALLRDAVAAVLPRCLLPSEVAPAEPGPTSFGHGADARKPGATDRRGQYNDCPHAAECAASARCPQLAEGWDPEGIHPL